MAVEVVVLVHQVGLLPHRHGAVPLEVVHHHPRAVVHRLLDVVVHHLQEERVIVVLRALAHFLQVAVHHHQVVVHLQGGHVAVAHRALAHHSHLQVAEPQLAPASGLLTAEATMVAAQQFPINLAHDLRLESLLSSLLVQEHLRYSRHSGFTASTLTHTFIHTDSTTARRTETKRNQ